MVYKEGKSSLYYLKLILLIFSYATSVELKNSNLGGKIDNKQTTQWSKIKLWKCLS